MNKHERWFLLCCSAALIECLSLVAVLLGGIGIVVGAIGFAAGAYVGWKAFEEDMGR